MAIKIYTVKELLSLVELFDGRGIVVTDEELQVGTIKELFPDLEDDYHDHPNTPDCVYLNMGLWRCGVTDSS